MSTRVCSTPGCPTRVPKGGYCDQHRKRGRAHRSPTTRAQDAEYQAERRRVLASNPSCHWCHAPNATTADHLVPVALGGRHQGNLVACCPTCNSSRQANLNWRPT